MVFLGGPNVDIKVQSVVGGMGLSGGDITDTDNSNTIYSISEEHVPLPILESDSISIATGNGLKNGSTVQLGGSTTIDVETSDFTGSFLSVDGSDNIDVNIANGLEGDDTGNIQVDPSQFISVDNNGVSVNIASFLSNDGSDNIEVNIGNFLSGDGSDNIQVNLGNGLTGDGSDNITLQNDTLTVAGNDISLGGNSAINLSDLSDFQILDDTPLELGSNNDFKFEYDSNADELLLRDNNGVELFRQTKSGVINFLQGIDAGPISAPQDSFTQILNAPVTSALGAGSRVGYTFSLNNQNIIEIDGEVDGSGGIQNTSIGVSRKIVDSGTTIWDSENSYVPISSLEFSTVSVTGSNGLSGGNADLGGSVDISISGNLSLDSDLVAIDGETIWSESNTHIPESALETISNSSLTNSSITVSTGSGLSGGSSISLGGSNTISVNPSDVAGTFISEDGSTNFQVDITNGLENDGSGSIRTSGDSIAGSGLEQGTNAYEIDLINNSVTYTAGNGISSAGTVSLGSSTTISVDASTFITSDSSGISVNIGNGLNNDGSDNIALDESTSFSFTSDISFGSAININDGVKQFFGSNNDFSQRFDDVSGDWVLRDEDTGVDLIRQPKAGPTQFIQGADIGSIESPEDSFTQVINASVTSALSSGDTVGYTFAVDNQSVIEISAIGDGSGGIQSSSVGIDTLTDNGQGSIDFNVSGTKRAELDDSGNLDIEGSLTEGAAL